MRRRDAIATLVVGALIVLALLAVFAIDLSNNQARSRSDIESQAHQRAVLVAGLIDSVFGAVSKPDPQLLAEYGTPACLAGALAAKPRQQRVRRAAAIQRPGDGGLARLHGPGAERILPHRGKDVVRMIQQGGQPWALGDVLPYRRGGGVVELRHQDPHAVRLRESWSRATTPLS